jgi:hypothetical protein
MLGAGRKIMPERQQLLKEKAKDINKTIHTKKERGI